MSYREALISKLLSSLDEGSEERRKTEILYGYEIVLNYDTDQDELSKI